MGIREIVINEKALFGHKKVDFAEASKQASGPAQSDQCELEKPMASIILSEHSITRARAVALRAVQTYRCQEARDRCGTSRQA